LWLGLGVGSADGIVEVEWSWWWCLWCLWLGLTVGSAVVNSASVDGANVGLSLAKEIGPLLGFFDGWCVFLWSAE
jgi:hypothetical protein